MTEDSSSQAQRASSNASVTFPVPKMSFSSCLQQRSAQILRRSLITESSAARALGISVQRPCRRSLSSKPAYEGHIPLNWMENAFLAAGSAIMSLADPRRGGEY